VRLVWDLDAPGEKPLPAFSLVATAAALYSVVFLGGGVMLGLFLVHGGSLSEHRGLFLMHGGSVSEHPVLQFPDERRWRYWRRTFVGGVFSMEFHGEFHSINYHNISVFLMM
jgi:hypothetical protein